MNKKNHVAKVITYVGGDCCYLQLYQKVSRILSWQVASSLKFIITRAFTILFGTSNMDNFLIRRLWSI